MKNVYLKKMVLPIAIAGGSIVTASVYPSLASAQVPNLPTITAQSLLANVVSSKAPIYSGTISVVSNTGIPSAAISAAIPNSSGALPSLLVSALTGTTSYNYWVDGSSNARVQVPLSNGEIDLYASPSGAWVYDSSTNTATQVKAPATSATSATNSYTSSPTMTPASIASKILSKLPSGSTVSVATNAYVAGEPTYTLVVNPNDPNSLITSISLSVDANNYDPIGIAINTASGQALSVSFTQLSFTKPASSIFAFTPTSSMIQKTLSPTSGTSTTVMPTSPTSSTSSSSTTHLGQGFSSIVVHHATTTPSASVQKELSMLSKFGTAASTSLGSGYVVSLSFGSIFIASNGSYAAGAVSPSTLLAALG
ncbi:MAG: hypothetical protein M0019_10550 [Actinomycetota bacterium]|nr:hypothetical protein [Actinomycetota bacterium]